MSAFGLPQRVVVEEVVQQARRWQAQVPIHAFPRLLELALDGHGSVDVQLQAEADLIALGRIRGQLQTQVQLTCQRCLQAMHQNLFLKVDWTLVGSEADEDRLLSERDPVLVEQGVLPLFEVIEDELILAIPLIPRCEDEQCLHSSRAMSAEIVHNDRPSDPRPNPFMALKGQVKKD